MTGYGSGTAEAGEIRARVEIRSVNSRFSEIRLKLPQDLGRHEADLRRVVSERVRRGRVEVQVTVASPDLRAPAIRINRDLAARYLDVAAGLRADFEIRGELGIAELMRFPGVVEVETAEPDEEGPAALLDVAGRALEAALAGHDDDRRREGGQLASDLSSRIVEIGRLCEGIAVRADLVPKEARARLLERIQRLAPDVTLDESRIESEVALIADRADITEELVRLRAHLASAADLIADEDEPTGKKLEFLLQEILRETNTINSKSVDLEITRLALAVKSEIERMREQVQNVE